jgi:hypothetical protein
VHGEALQTMHPTPDPELLTLPRLSRRRAIVLLGLVVALRELEKAPEDKRQLRNLQERLLSLMVRTEGQVRKEKNKNRELRSHLHVGRPAKDVSKKLRDAIAASDARVEDHQHWLYVLRCVGDGIAHIYLPPLVLRHASLGPPIGFISQKAGSILERRLWRMLLRKTEAAGILCDITNCLRVGDICVLHPSKIYSFAEVKQPGHRPNARSKRQNERANAIMEYLMTDESNEIVAGQTLRAFAPSMVRVDHSESVNALFPQARLTGLAWHEAEPGLRYVLIDTQSSVSITHLAPTTSGLGKPVVWYVSTTSTVWPHYRPYMLSLRSPRAAVEFAGGRFSLWTLASTEHIASYCKERGYSTNFLDPEADGYAIELRSVEGERWMRISSGYVAQCAINLESLRSLLDQALERVDSIVE